MSASSESKKAYWRATLPSTAIIAAASLFPIIVLGIFWKRMNKEGAIAPMLSGLIATAAYISYFKFMGGTADGWWFGVSPEGIGFVFMWLALAVGILTALVTPAPPSAIQQLVEDIRIPGQRGALHE